MGAIPFKPRLKTMKNNIPNLIEYIRDYAERGPCTCGRCIDAVANPESKQPDGAHTVDVVFFKISARPGADATELRNAIAAHRGEYGECNPLDGKEHGFLELGGYVGDQGLALMLMGLGAALGLWKLITPYTVLGKGVPPDLAKTMAGSGLITIQATHG
jgi:hypothetical protein